MLVSAARNTRLEISRLLHAIAHEQLLLFDVIAVVSRQWCVITIRCLPLWFHEFVQLFVVLEARLNHVYSKKTPETETTFDHIETIYRPLVYYIT